MDHQNGVPECPGAASRIPCHINRINNTMGTDNLDCRVIERFCAAVLQRQILIRNHSVRLVLPAD
jgi:hypothetical protein